MVMVTYRRWSLTRGSNCKALTGKILVFWIGGCLWKVVSNERWLHMEVRLYFFSSHKFHDGDISILNLSFTFPQLEMDNFHNCLIRVMH